MPTIYEQHTAAFARVEAYCVSRDGKRVASVAFKFPADGAGRLYCYLHVFGAPMSRGFASGGGYDKRTAAFETAAAKHSRDAFAEDIANIEAIQAAAKVMDGTGWDRALRDVGFDVWQAV